MRSVEVGKMTVFSLWMFLVESFSNGEEISSSVGWLIATGLVMWLDEISDSVIWISI